MNPPSGFDRVIEHFSKHGWSCSWNRKDSIVRAGSKGLNIRFRLQVQVNEADDLVVVWATLPIVVAGERRTEAAALCAYLSSGMRMGRFEMDPVTGDIRFQASSGYAPGQLSDSIIEKLIGVTAVMLDEHFPAFVEVICGKAVPAEAAQKIRGQICRGLHPSRREVVEDGARLEQN